MATNTELLIIAMRLNVNKLHSIMFDRTEPIKLKCIELILKDRGVL